MLLTVKERLLAVQALPKEGDIFTQRIVRDLRAKLGLSEEDWKTYDIKNEGGRVVWNPAKDLGVEYSFGEKAKELIVESLTDLNKQKKVTEDYLSLYDKFIPAESVEKPEENIAVKAKAPTPAPAKA